NNSSSAAIKTDPVTYFQSSNTDANLNNYPDEIMKWFPKSDFPKPEPTTPQPTKSVSSDRFCFDPACDLHFNIRNGDPAAVPARYLGTEFRSLKGYCIDNPTNSDSIQALFDYYQQKHAHASLSW